MSGKRGGQENRVFDKQKYFVFSFQKNSTGLGIWLFPPRPAPPAESRGRDSGADIMLLIGNK